MKNLYNIFFLLLLSISLMGQDEYVIPNAIVGSCVDLDSNTVTLIIDYNKNCPEADPTGVLAGQEELVMHTGINNWATVLPFDDENAVRIKNIGNDIFSVTINTMETYGTALADIEDIRFIPNNGLADPADPWAVSMRDDQGGGGFGGTDPCNDFELRIAAAPSCAELAQESSKSLFGVTTIASSCIDSAGGNVTIQFDQSLNCPEADTAGALAGATALGFHSGANDWASTVAWDDDGAMQAVNDGNNIFSVTVNVMDYYGVSLDSLTNIKMVMNNGVANPEDPWSISGRDERDGGFGGTEPCSDLIFIVSEASACPVEPVVITSAALSSAMGDVSTCVDPNTGRARISFDLSLNCPEADSTMALVGAAALGFHSGANNWSSTVAWDDSSAMQAVNDGNDIFSVTVDIASYYGVEFDSLENILMVMNNGPAAPDAPWDASGRDDRDAESFGSINPCSDLILQISEASTCDLSDPPETISSEALLSAGSCIDTRTNLVKIAFDQTQNCPEADTANVLAGMEALAFHSGANNWASIVAWDDDGAKTASNDGNNVFELVLNPETYYGLPFDSITNIEFLFNNGLASPDDPWTITGKDSRDGTGFGGAEPCSNLLLDFSELPGCDLSETATSHALFNGTAASCVDSTTGSITLQFDYSFNCPEADSAKLLAGQEMIAFHSGINGWSVQVPWDDSTAMAAVNNGSDLFSLTIDPMAYYGMPLDSVQEINFLFNNGLAAPDDPWSNKGEDARDGTGFGGSPCSNLLFKVSEAPQCAASTNVRNLVLETNLKVVPNPFSSSVTIFFDNPKNESYDLFITDITGKLVRSVQNIRGNQVRIDRRSMTAGMYIANLRDRTGRFTTAKLMVK